MGTLLGLTRADWREAAAGTFRRARVGALTDRAAALTYYGMLSLFPALLVLVALLGLVGEHPRTTDALLQIVSDVGPASAVDSVRGPLEEVVSARGGAGALLGIGLVIALWSASGYVGAFARAGNEIWQTTDSRPLWKRVPAQLALTAGLALAVAVIAVIIAVSGPLAAAIGDVVGLGSTARTAWAWGRWPVLLVLVAGICVALYRFGPATGRRGVRWLVPGAVLAVVTLIVASSLFAGYVASVGSYAATYGALGGVVAFLVWLWLANVALLAGMLFDAEVARVRDTPSTPVAASAAATYEEVVDVPAA